MYTRKSWSTDKMMPALSGINTLSKEKSVFLCYTRKSWSMKMMPALSGINTLCKEKSVFLCKEKSVFLCYTRKSWSMTR